ncbi:hypothetical protein T492DRAFT_874007 [Pavlovales sp. CCMP2436]|nr:hypothetical protein T492DRAFT_874007 [Pavlovales sp. CCMP2436]
MMAMPSGFKEIINKDGLNVYLLKSAVEANFFQHPDIKAKRLKRARTRTRRWLRSQVVCT